MSKDEVISQYCPLDLVSKGRWEHALFTTYSLSLSFYETQLHKLGLAQNGCRNIQIVADVDGYQLSLSERQSYRIGNEYRLTPAALPNGVFHPKITWLASKQQDLVLLGSGNLTFGGYGKNLECADIIRSDTQPQLFSQVAQMLSDWADRDDLTFAESDWLEYWCERARGVGTTSSQQPVDTPVLLHSTRESVGSQIIRTVRAWGKVAEVRSLSPFYDPDANGILSFAESVQARRLSIGLLKGNECQSGFPFGETAKSEINLSAAHFAADGVDRRLHAKVLEIHMEDGSIFLVTGSVNATRKSLLTSDNIETAILRYYPPTAPLPFAWTPTNIPGSFERPEFQRAGLGNRIVVSARLTGEGRLEGKLISRTDPSGRWDGFLQLIDGTMEPISFSSTASGQFSSQLALPDHFKCAVGLQIHVIKCGLPGSSGSGWVSVESLLIAAKRGFLSASTLLRLLGSDADENDETELLRYLATSANRHLSAFQSNRTSTKHTGLNGEEAGKGDSSITVPVDLLTYHQQISQGENGNHGNRDDEVLNTLLGRIRENLLRSHRDTTPQDDIEGDGDDSSSKKEQQERERSQYRLKVTLDDFQRSLSGLAESLPAGTERSGALCMWFEGIFPILLRRLNEPDEVEAFMRRWVNSCLTAQRRSNSTEILSFHVLSTMLTLAAIELPQKTNHARTLVLLHEQIEAFCEADNPKAVCTDLDIFDSVNPPPVAEWLGRLSSSLSLADALEKIVATPTTRQQIATIEKASSNGTEFDEQLPILRLAAGVPFLASVKEGRQPPIRELKPTMHCCPHCHINFPKANLHEIERDRFGICVNCNKFLLATI